MADISSLLKTRVSSSDKTDHPKQFFIHFSFILMRQFCNVKRCDVINSYGITNHKNMPWYIVRYLLRR